MGVDRERLGADLDSNLGLALRLWYQSGLVGAPPLDATTSIEPSSWGKYTSGVTRTVPLFAPMWWSRIIGAPSK